MKFELFTWIEIHRFSSGQRNGSNAGQVPAQEIHTSYTFVNGSQNSEHSALIKSVRYVSSVCTTQCQHCELHLQCELELGNWASHNRHGSESDHPMNCN